MFFQLIATISHVKVSHNCLILTGVTGILMCDVGSEIRLKKNYSRTFKLRNIEKNKQ